MVDTSTRVEKENQFPVMYYYTNSIWKKKCITNNKPNNSAKHQFSIDRKWIMYTYPFTVIFFSGYSSSLAPFMFCSDLALSRNNIDVTGYRKKVKEGNDQEMVQAERNSKNRSGKKLN